MNHAARWVAVVPAALLTLYLAPALLLWTLLGAVHGLCPEASRIGSVCAASWYPLAERGAIVAAAALAAFTIVLVGSITAPGARPRVAWALFAALVAMAIFMVVSTRAYPEFGAALAGGLFAVFVVTRFMPREAAARRPFDMPRGL